MYEVQVWDKDSGNWETFEKGDSDSRRKFLKGFDRKKVVKRQWRCIKV